MTAPVPPTVTAVAAALARRLPGLRGDWMLGEHLRHPGPLRAGAVLVLLRDGPAGAEVLLTQRSATLTLHPGDVCFPGGGLEPDDRSPEAAALREAAEEVGLPPAAVEVLGRLDDHEGAIGWRLVPVIGRLRHSVSLALHEREVAAAAWVPLAALAGTAGRKIIPSPVADRITHRFPLAGLSGEVWGMTAGILVNLLEVAGLPTAAHAAEDTMTHPHETAWASPVPLALRPTDASESFRDMPTGVTGLPLAPHPGSFAFERKNHTHEGVDLYCPEGTAISAVETGTVVAVLPFTGGHCTPPSDWWHDTWAVMLDGASGVVLYGEIVPAPGVAVGVSLARGALIGHATPVLKKDKGRPMCMLHLELYEAGARDCVEWLPGAPRPALLRDPTPFLLAAAGVGPEVAP